jgi:2'-5' RNA ligase
MPRLFTAISLPPAIYTALAGLQPAPASSLRLVAPEQMHVTLHFIGEAEIERIASLLRAIAMPACEVMVSGVGQFSQGAVLWAGVQANAALLELHTAIGTALAAGGIAIETRPYRPHITLARCKPQFPRDIIGSFIECNAALQLPPVTVTQFALYSSHSSVNGPVYRVEKWFPA